MGMHEDQLIIRASLGTATFEIVPEDIWGADVPLIPVVDTVQWFDLDRKEVEFRPKTAMWRPSTKNLFLRFNEEDSGSSSMGWEYTVLLDVNKEQHLNYLKPFRFFEDLRFIHVTLNRKDELEIDLPRFGLRFFVNKNNELESRELAGFIISPDQRVGSLHGLQSKLVVEAIHPQTSQLQRDLIIPFGDTDIKRNEAGHVYVHITAADTDRKRIFHRYAISRELQCLQPSEGSSFRTKIWLPYLHAITTSIEPDALTGVTGMAMSIVLLHQAWTKTTRPLDIQTVKVLRNIALSSPRRSYYPEGVKTAEKVQYNKNLTIYAQNPSYQLIINEIMSFNRRLSFSFPLRQPLSTPDCAYTGENELLRRAACMWRHIYPAYAFDLMPSPVESIRYCSREDLESLEQRSAYELERLIDLWPEKFDVSSSVWPKFLQLRHISGFGQSIDDSTMNSLLTLDLGEHWGRLLHRCVNAYKPIDGFSLSRQMSLVAFGHPNSLATLQHLLLFAFRADFKDIQVPAPVVDGYHVDHGASIDTSWLNTLMDRVRKPLESEEEHEDDESNENENDANVDLQTEVCLRAIRESFPAESPNLPSQWEVPLLDLDALRVALLPRWRSCVNNNRLRSFATEMEQRLESIGGRTKRLKLCVEPIQTSIEASSDPDTSQYPICSLLTLVARDAADDIAGVDPLVQQTLDQCLSRITTESDPVDLENRVVPETHIELRSVLDKTAKFHPADSTYLADLKASLNALLQMANSSTDVDSATLISSEASLPILMRHLSHQRKMLQNLLQAFTAAIIPKRWPGRLLSLSGLWPRVSLPLLLQTLAVRYRANLPNPWLKSILKLGLFITSMQKCRRLVKLLSKQKYEECIREIQNRGHGNWKVEDHPDWLLFEIEQDLLIRDIQVDVAREMISPASGRNTLVQLLMGQGKTKVILPLVACELANGNQLPEVVVLRQLLPMMLTDVSDRLSGLISRIVINFEISRSTAMNLSDVDVLQALHEECCADRSVLITTPETQLSLQLLAVDKLGVAETEGIGKKLIRLQKWRNEKARVVLDEADQVLDLKTEQVYTSGSPIALRCSPERWTIAQQLYGLAVIHMKRLAEEYPEEIEFIPKPHGAFPHVRILQHQCGERLVALLAEDIIKGRLCGLDFLSFDSIFVQNLRSFITERDITEVCYKEITDEYANNSSQMDMLYICRGMLLHGILLYPLKDRRHNVNYGLSLDRCLHAVPYINLFRPSARADFANVDILVVTTEISYCMDGLTQAQFRQCVSSLLDTPSCGDIWGQWVEQSGIPAEYRAVTNIDLDETECFDRLYGHLRFCKVAIDFFLNLHVYPKVSEYSFKLEKSAADIVTSDTGLLTTGFSGTLDTRSNVCRDIDQANLSTLAHSDAQVMAMLLRKENRKCHLSGADGLNQGADHLPAFICNLDRSVDVVIDAMAQFVTDSKSDSAQKLLGYCNEDNKKAAVYFDETGQCMVVSRDGKIDRFDSSSYRQSLEQCIFYLSDAESRGVDINFPDYFHAAVTLGPGMRRDQLVQSVMRLRKLGSGQSLCCIVPPEVVHQIRAMKGMVHVRKFEPTIADVIQWTVSNSCSALQSQRSLCVLRTLSYIRRSFVMDQYVNSSDPSKARHLIEGLRERDSFSPEELYSPVMMGHIPLPFKLDKQLKARLDVRELLAEWTALSGTKHLDAEIEVEIEVETEKELAKEVETEKELSKPPPFKPCKHVVSKGLLAAIFTGRMDPTHCLPAFRLFLETSAVKDMLEPEAWDGGLLVTKDYSETVEGDYQIKDSVLKPVNFVVSFKHNPGQLVVISQFEANAIIPTIKDSKVAMLHIFAPRDCRGMDSYEDLDVFAITGSREKHPTKPELQIQLAIFSGQLYFPDGHHYEQMCDYLGILKRSRSMQSDDGQPVCDSTRFVAEQLRQIRGWNQCPFAQNPLPFLRKILLMRNKGRDISRTPMGGLPDGRVPTAKELKMYD